MKVTLFPEHAPALNNRRSVPHSYFFQITVLLAVTRNRTTSDYLGTVRRSVIFEKWIREITNDKYADYILF